MESKKAALVIPLCDLRRRAHMTQQELADMIGVSRVTVTNYELGNRRIPMSMLLPIRDALNCTWDELLIVKGE